MRLKFNLMLMREESIYIIKQKQIGIRITRYNGAEITVRVAFIIQHKAYVVEFRDWFKFNWGTIGNIAPLKPNLNVRACDSNNLHIDRWSVIGETLEQSNHLARKNEKYLDYRIEQKSEWSSTDHQFDGSYKLLNWTTWIYYC